MIDGSTAYVSNEVPNGSTSEPSWSEFYADAKKFEAGLENTLFYQNTTTAHSSVPAGSNHLITNFPMFDMGIPDQFRVDVCGCRTSRRTSGPEPCPR